MFERHKLEREEGKSYKDPEASDKMRDLNKRFAMWHGVSSLANVGIMLAFVFHGLWITNFGLGDR